MYRYDSYIFTAYKCLQIDYCKDKGKKTLMKEIARFYETNEFLLKAYKIKPTN